jgi:hypothetical protein
MKNFKWYGAAVLLSVIALYLAGCGDSTSPSATSAAVQNAATKLHGYLPGLAGGDTAIGNGMFSVSWRKVRKPHDSTTTIAGNVIGICFPDSFKPGSGVRPKSADAGTVTLTYNGSTITLQKNTTPRGVMYSLPRTPGGTAPSVSFVPGVTYAFSASGSSSFQTFQGSVSAPQGLIAITSPTKNGTTDTVSDLTITWSGGAAGGNVMITVNAMPPHHGPGRPGGSDSGSASFHGGKGRRGMRASSTGGQSLTMADRGTDNHWGTQGGGRGGHGGEWGGRRARGGSGHRNVTVKLTSNPGSYTIPIATLKSLPHFGSGTRLSISVNEMYKTAFAHDSGSVSVGFRSGDHVGIVVK